MFATIKRFINQFFKKSRSVNNKPLNPLSLAVVVCIDLFILYNVFSGLNNISQWHISPTQAYPCVSEWKSYRDPKATDRDYLALLPALDDVKEPGFQRNNQFNQQDHLGEVSPICTAYDELQDKVGTPANRKTQQIIKQKREKIANLEQANSSIRSQYDSTLLEKIAGQGAGQSINNVSAEKAKQTLEQNKVSITTLKKEIAALKDSLLQQPESVSLLNLIKDDAKYQVLQDGLKNASFWYPSIQLGFQALFLLPLIAIALLVHQFALRKGWGLIALISWHLLAIFFIPLLLKIFEFLQIGVLFQFLLDIVTKLFGGLLFLVNYLYILLIPLVGFGIIKLAQRFTPSNKSQEVFRFHNQLCLSCAKKIRPQDPYCPHCGYSQYTQCQNCHQVTYKHLAHCKECGHAQESRASETTDPSASISP
jgi:predicted RNA-binding Zn-ribbon protein involved in translation (DUF1610 family)